MEKKIITIFAIMIYSVWKALNIQQHYFENNHMTMSNVWNIFFSLLMCYWLMMPSILFLLAKILDGLFSLFLGTYLYVIPGPDDLKKDREQIINGYWHYTLTDLVICVTCFILSLIGSQQ